MATTIHGKTPRGRAFCAGMRSSYMVTTENPAEVTCLRCAKAMGITAAAKPQSDNRTGTCQCCFRPQKVSKGGGKLMSLHGYKRPGDGYIFGECRGQEHQPFEVSCERTKTYRQELENFLAGQNELLVKYQTNGFDQLSAMVRTGKRTAHSNEKYARQGLTEDEKVCVLVSVGQEEMAIPFTGNSYYGDALPSYESLKETCIKQVERIIHAVETDIATLTQKIDGWKQIWAE